MLEVMCSWGGVAPFDQDNEESTDEEGQGDVEGGVHVGFNPVAGEVGDDKDGY